MTRPLTAGAMRKANKPVRERTPKKVYTVTRDGVEVFTGTVGKLRTFLGMHAKSAKDALQFRLDNGITEEVALKAPSASVATNYKRRLT